MNGILNCLVNTLKTTSLALVLLVPTAGDRQISHNSDEFFDILALRDGTVIGAKLGDYTWTKPEYFHMFKGNNFVISDAELTSLRNFKNAEDNLARSYIQRANYYERTNRKSKQN
jgi:hypothetical protein